MGYPGVRGGLGAQRGMRHKHHILRGGEKGQGGVVRESDMRKRVRMLGKVKGDGVDCGRVRGRKGRVMG